MLWSMRSVWVFYDCVSVLNSWIKTLLRSRCGATTGNQILVNWPCKTRDPGWDPQRMIKCTFPFFSSLLPDHLARGKERWKDVRRRVFCEAEKSDNQFSVFRIPLASVVPAGTSNNFAPYSHPHNRKRTIYFPLIEGIVEKSKQSTSTVTVTFLLHDRTRDTPVYYCSDCLAWHIRLSSSKEFFSHKITWWVAIIIEWPDCKSTQ